MDVITKLLDLYEKHPVSAIEEGDGSLLLAQFYVSNLNELMAIPGYPEAFSLVSRSARTLADFISRYPDAPTQVREAVRLLRKMRDDAEPERNIEVLQTLVEGQLRSSWPASLQAEYDEKKQILEWRDFFVSYTNRDAQSWRKDQRGSRSVLPESFRSSTAD